MKSNVLISLFLTFLTMGACSRGDSGSSANSPGTSPSDLSTSESISLSYEMNDSGCKTGDHKFASQAAMCAGLQNNQLNNNCALKSRSAFFSKNCPNQTFTPVDAPLAQGKTHSLQITTINFLTGGRENCDVKNKIFVFSATPQKAETPICENSLVRVSASNQDGVVTFHVTEIVSGRELPPTHGATTESAKFILGKSKGMLRYGADNPYGFTYIMAEEVTGYDPLILAQINELNGRAATLRAEILTTQQDGRTVAPEKIVALRQLEAEGELLSKKLLPEPATN